MNVDVRAQLAKEVDPDKKRRRAVVVGYGPVGQTASRILRGFDVETVIIDLNLETVRSLVASGQPAIYGDSTQRDILEAAGIESAEYLLVTVPDVMTRTSVIITAKELNEKLRVFVRARYIQERAWVEEVGATEICTEEAETALGLAVLLLREVGADENRILSEIDRIKRELGVRRGEYEGLANT
jgi:CPA2 family monovalent cation:H+ antiporter-2